VTDPASDSEKNRPNQGIAQAALPDDLGDVQTNESVEEQRNTQAGNQNAGPSPTPPKIGRITALQQPIIIPKGSDSEGRQMSEIETLTTRIADLTRSVDLWNTVMLWALAIAAIAGLFAVLATRKVVTLSGKLSTAQDSLGSAKDRQLQTDLKNKDVEIGKLKLRSDTAEAGVATAEADAAKATEKAEAERLARRKLEAQIAPRRLTGEQKSRLSDRLKQNPGNIVIVSAILDGESSDFANDLNDVFTTSGWKTLRYSNRITEERGILIGTVEGTKDGGEAEEIKEILATVDIEARPSSFKSDDHTTSPWFEKGVLYLVINHKPDVKTKK
jgi:hypothetical protein